ncbi:MAG: hypothetical protein ABIQ35_01620 [Verrucomicrobiota bacterium]
MKHFFSPFPFTFFAVLFTSALTVSAGDISFYGLIKEQRLVQTNNAAPIPDTNAPFSLQCFVDSSGPDLITDASIRLPGGASRLLTRDGEDEYSFQDVFSTASGLNGVYPAGNYTLTVDSENDIFSTAPLSMPTAVFPNVPQITNYTSAQAVNPNNAFTFNWVAFAGGTTSDFIEFAVRGNAGNAVFRSADLGQPNALNGTNTSIVIPGGTFFSGETYLAELMFAKITTRDSSSIPGATGVVGFTTRTTFAMKTTGQAATVSLQVVGYSGGNFQFRFNSQPGKIYQLQFADSLTNWQNLFYTNATATEVDFTDAFAGFNSNRFYRVMVP